MVKSKVACYITVVLALANKKCYCIHLRLWYVLFAVIFHAVWLYVAGLRPPKKEKKPQQRLMELSVCLEELMDTPTFKRFNTALDGVLEAAEDMDLASIRGYLFSLLAA